MLNTIWQSSTVGKTRAALVTGRPWKNLEALSSVSSRSSSSTLKKKLAYERTEAVKLLKRFYGDEIDAYLRALDKYKRAEGQVLYTSDRIWQASKIGTTIYQVDCNVKGKIALLGTKSGSATTDYPIYCGSYIVDLDEKTVEARDDMAKRVAQKEY